MFENLNLDIGFDFESVDLTCLYFKSIDVAKNPGDDAENTTSKPHGPRAPQITPPHRKEIT